MFYSRNRKKVPTIARGNQTLKFKILLLLQTQRAKWPQKTDCVSNDKFFQSFAESNTHNNLFSVSKYTYMPTSLATIAKV